ncbi:odorant receptor 4-like [Nymphalis io]|uniref:odorant receptor 4-like n=1 Tax=Inachis io TaxID=171585 RepID=UPI002167707E|nr:odorant receptor 4-like [Nymphalis io]
MSSKKNSLEAQEKVYKGNVDDYDKTYVLAKKILKMIGLPLTEKLTKFSSFCWNSFFWFNFANILLSTALETTNLFVHASIGTFLDLFKMMPCVGFLLVAIAKAYKIKRYWSVFENLALEPRAMWPTGDITEEEHKVISDALDRLKIVLKVYFLCNAMLASIFTLPSMIAWIKNRTGHDVELIFGFSYWLPFDPFQGNRYEIVYFIQTFHCFLSAGFMVCGDLLFCIFLSHITTQFSLLAIRINRLLYVPIDDQLVESYTLAKYTKIRTNMNDIESVYDNDAEQRYNEEFISIVKRHRALIRLSSDVENMYTFTLLVNFINSSVIICFCLFCCAVIEKWNEFNYKIFCLTSILQIWMLCWYGQQLLDTSTGVADALYNCGWYMASKGMKKSVLIMMQRSQSEVYVTTYGFSIVSLDSYATILKTSWSYFTLLINMYKE